jgi:hypothetical protein
MKFTSKKHKKLLLSLLAAALVLLGILAYLGDFPPGDLEGRSRKSRIRITQPTTTQTQTQNHVNSQTPLPEQNINLDLSPLQGAGGNIDIPENNIDWPGGL